MKRRDLLLLGGVFAASAAPTVRARPPATPFRIAIANPGVTADEWRKLPLYRDLFPGLSHLGEVEGQNLVVEHFTAEGQIDRYADLARRVVERDPDVIVCLTGDLCRR
jgi:putative ABC transport system substrate-binding protein